MDAKREQALVGLFVLIAAGLLLGTVVAVRGTFRRGGVSHRPDEYAAPEAIRAGVEVLAAALAELAE